MKYLLHTYGCQMNVRDAEAVAACLEMSGHLPAVSEDDADLIIVNTCSVRGKAEDKAVGKLGLLCAGKRTAPHRLVGVMGCMAQRRGAALLKKIPQLDFVLGTRQQQALPALLPRLAAGERGILLLEFRVKGTLGAPTWEYRGVLERIVDTVSGGKKDTPP